MAQGILSGIGLGVLFSVGVAGVISVVVPIEPQPAPQTSAAETETVAEAVAPANSDSVTPAEPAAEQPTVPETAPETTAEAQPQAPLPAPASEELPTQPEVLAPAPRIATTLDSTVQAGGVTPAPVAVPRVDAVAQAVLPQRLPPVDGGASDDALEGLAALPVPQTGTAADLTTPRPLPEGVVARLAQDEPVLPNPQALAPMIPDDSPDSEVADQNPVALAQAEASAVPQTEGETSYIVVEPAPAAEPEAVAEIAPESVAELPVAESAPEAEVATETPTEPETQPEPETQIATFEQPEAPVVPAAPRPRVLAVPGTPQTTLGADARLSIGRPANSLIPVTPQAGATELETVTQASVNPADTAPVRRFSAPFENAEGKPLMSIVLMDAGVDLDAGQIGLPALASFPYPVSFAVQANLPDAVARMERYRAEGFEVLAIVDLPQAAQPTDAEVSLSVTLNNLPEIVGVLEGTGEGLQGSREVADQVVGILRASGHGLVTQSKGLNSMPKLAVKDGVPAAPVFRDFDSADQTPRVIRRFLDQAAFVAGQEGGVIMLGRLRPETIEALLVWGLADRAGSVAMAPISAVLLSQR